MNADNAPSSNSQMPIQCTSVLAHLLPMAVGAVLWGLAYPAIGWYWTAHIALAPFAVVAILSTRVRRLFWTSYLVGFAWWLIMLFFLWDVTVGGYAALCLYMSLYVPIALCMTRTLHNHWRIPITIALPAAWAVAEFLRGQLPAGGFNWFCFSHTAAPWLESQGPSRLLQTADLFGEWTTTFLIAMTSGLLADVFITLKNHPKSTRIKRIAKPAIAWLLLIASALAYGEFRIRQTDESLSTEGLTVALVQTNVPHSNKLFPTPDQVERDWQEMLALTLEAATQTPKPDLIIWPETMAPASLNREALQHYMNVGSQRVRYAAELQTFADEHQVNLLIGASSHRDYVEVEEDGAVYLVPRERRNSAFLIQPGMQGEFEKSDKIHRVPFGEYIPWVSAVPWLKKQFISILSPYDFDYSLVPGERYTKFFLRNEEAEFSFATPICFEDAFSRDTRKMAYEGSEKYIDFLFNLTNDGWYSGQSQRPQHFQIAAIRSIETRCPLARSVNTGISGFIDSAGRVGPFVTVDGKRQRVAGIAANKVHRDSRNTLFGFVGRIPIVLLTLLVIGLCIAGYRRNARNSDNIDVDDATNVDAASTADRG